MADIETFHLRPEGERAFGYAQATRVGNLLHLAGSLSVDDDFEPQHGGDMGAQVASVYRSIERILAQFGASLSSVVRECIFVTDMDAFLAANSVRIEAYSGHFPATTAVEVRRLAFPACLIEVEVTAIL